MLAGGDRGKHIARLGPGAIVGEMSLMTGARRSATVIAATEVEALEVTKPALAPILEASPDLVDRFAAVLKKRQAGLDRALSGRHGVMEERGFASLIRGSSAGKSSRGAKRQWRGGGRASTSGATSDAHASKPPMRRSFLSRWLQDDVGQAVVEERVAEPVDDARAVGRRLGDARRGEDRQDSSS